MGINIDYREIYKNEEINYRNLLSSLEKSFHRKDFFFPDIVLVDSVFTEGFAKSVGAFHDNILIGITTLVLKPEGSYIKEIGENNKKICEVRNGFVDLKYRGNGIAYEIMKELLKLACNYEFDIVIVKVHPENIAAVKVVEKEFVAVKNIYVADNIPRTLYKKIIVK